MMINKKLLVVVAAALIVVATTSTITYAAADRSSGYNGLNKADQRIHDQGPGLFSKGDVEFHTGTGQGGFCVSGVCPPR